jgi:mRNA-degrading endonuclease YafQ of YafQ-DinJ toxin-antitoxin module
MTFDVLTEFKKDLKNLLKKYRTLNEDLDVVKQVLEVTPDERPPFSFRIDNLGLETCVIKVKKIACKALKGSGVNSGLRLIYAYYEEEERIIFVELYHKNDKENEDRERVLNNFK